MPEKNPSYIIIGQIGSTYGVKGWLKVRSFTELSSNLLHYKPWYISLDKQTWRDAHIMQVNWHGKGVIAKFANVDTPEEARLLTGTFIGITRAQLPVLKENEYYWSDLIGLTVFNAQGESLGKVIYLLETGANDVLVVKNEKEHAIPFLLGKVILEIDLANKKIIVDWEII